MVREITDFVTENLRPHSADADRAAELLAGRLTLGEVTSALPAGLDWEGAEKKFGARHTGALHGFRWLDVLRRESTASDDQAALLWGQLVASWATHMGGRQGGPPWYSRVLSERLRVLALGAPLVRSSPWFTKLIDKHRAAAYRWFANPAAHLRWEHMIESLAALHVTGFVDSATMSQAVTRWVRAAVDDQGWCSAGDVPASEEVREGIAARLRVLADDGIDVMAAQERLANRRFAQYLVDPFGNWVGMGERSPEPGYGEHDPHVTYSLTHGEEGEPPTELGVVASNGYICRRSGFGENERTCDQETMMTVLFGPADRPGAHLDGGRITYSADGVSWLIDPVGDRHVAVDEHSTATLDLPYHAAGAVTSLVRHERGDQADLYVLRSNGHRPGLLTRSIAWSDVGEYFIVTDRSEKATAKLQQHWIVPPEVEITLPADTDGSCAVWFACGGVSFALHAFGAEPGGARVEKLSDQAQRVTFTRADGQDRLVTWGGRVVEPQKHDVVAESAPWGVLVRVEDKAYSEAVAMAVDGVAVLAHDAGLEEAGRRLSTAAAGSAFPLESRAAALDLIKTVKDAAWESGGDPQVRADGIRRLKEFVDQHGLMRSANHGTGAAMVDLASRDLTNLLQDELPPGAQRRDPVINWSGSSLDAAGLEHSFYKVPIVTSRGRSEPIASDRAHLRTFDYGSLVVPVYVRPRSGRTLLVSFYGALDRTKIRLPYFSMLRSFQALPIPLMVLSDPLLDLDGGMRLSWYLGVEEIDIHREVAKIIEDHAQQQGFERVILFGSSGGGFTALQVGSHLPGCQVITANPQVRLSHYSPRATVRAALNAFGVEEVPEGQASRMDALQRYREIGFDRDVLYVQNTGDQTHMTNHFEPFVAEFKASRNAHRLDARTNYTGPGHRAGTPQTFINLVKEFLDR